jgi:quinol monooxygenase YgiN
MYARVVLTEARSDKLDAGIEGVEKALQESISKFQGFLGAYLLVNRSTNKAIYMTLYESKENADASMQSGASQDVVSKFLDLMVGTPTIEDYEVAIKI